MNLEILGAMLGLKLGGISLAEAFKFGGLFHEERERRERES